MGNDTDTRAAVNLYGTPEEKQAQADAELFDATAASVAANSQAAADAEAESKKPRRTRDEEIAATMYPEKEADPERSIMDRSGRPIVTAMPESDPDIRYLLQRNAEVLMDADLDNKGDISRVILDGCNASRASFRNTTVGQAKYGNFQNCRLEGTVFKPGSSVAASDFRGCSVDEHTSLAGVDITGSVWDPGTLEKTKDYKKAIGRPRVKQ